MLMVLIPLCFIGFISVLVYLGLSRLLRIEEAEPIIAKINSILSGSFMVKKSESHD